MRPPAARCEVRGHRQQAALKDQRFRGRVPPLYPLTRAHEVDSATRWGRHSRFHFREIRFGAAAIAASVSGATRSGRLGGAAAAGRRRHRGDDGARALVANAADELMMGAAAGRALQVRGHRQQAALKDQRFRGRVPPLYPLDSRARGRQRDPLGPPQPNSILEKFGSGPRRSLRRSAERPARAAWAALRLLADVAIGATMELGRSWRTLLMS